jgi:hypothetical protein
MKGVLAEHLHVPGAPIESDVFPDSGRARAISGLFRA